MIPSRVRNLEERDASALAAIVERSPEAAQWVPAVGLEGQVSNYTLVVELGSTIGGFLSARLAAGEAEILNIAVDPGYRRCGHGHALLAAALADLKRLGSDNVFLEVRARNQAAISFYEKHGFVRTGCRKHYYRNPEDDAVTMRAIL